MKFTVSAAKPTPNPGRVTLEQIETVNLRRMVYTCVSALGIQLMNLLNPNF